MITMMVDHPDIEEFIKIKSDTDTVKHANISVKLTDEFMKAVDGDKDFKLRWGGKTFKTVKAKALWDKIISQAHAHAEPGLMFWDHMTDDHNIEYIDPIKGTNPCGEIPLPKYVDPDGKFWFETFQKDVKIGIRFLDNVIEYNIKRHALPIISETVTKNRRTGLGITGLADALIKMGIEYDSGECLAFVDDLFGEMKYAAYSASIELAGERGSFGGFEADKFLKSGFAKRLPQNIKNGIREIGMRNCTLLTIAPVGTGSIIAQCSSGMEPIYQLWYERDVKRDTSRGAKDTYKVYHKLISDMFGEVSERKDLPGFVRTAYDVSADMRVQVQGAIQKHIDSSISSTINLPENTKKDTVSDIYIKAWKAGLKGVTVYREGSREGVIRTVVEPKKEKPKKRPVKLEGSIYKIPIQQDSKLYVTICPFDDDTSRPFEVFLNINNGNATRQADLDAMSWMISALLRRTDNIDFILDKFRKTTDPSIRAWFSDPNTGKGTSIGSIPKAIAVAFDMFIYENAKGRKKKDLAPKVNLKRCTNPSCGEKAVVHENGCDHCIYCGFSEGCS
jgi:ribonucleoside-diphosphate reductase alpha chain